VNKLNLGKNVEIKFIDNNGNVMTKEQVRIMGEHLGAKPVNIHTLRTFINDLDNRCEERFDEIEEKINKILYLIF